MIDLQASEDTSTKYGTMYLNHFHCTGPYLIDGDAHINLES